MAKLNACLFLSCKMFARVRHFLHGFHVLHLIPVNSIRYVLCLVFTINLVQAQNAISTIQPKLPDGKLVKDEFFISQQDTVYKYYERVVFSIEESDTIMLVETYRLNRLWTLGRYIVSGDASIPCGWQQEFDMYGTITTERFCDTATGKCNVRKQYHYYPNGHPMAVLQYNKQKLEGLSTFYYNSGSLKYTLDYRNNRIWNILDYLDQQGNTLAKGDFANGNGSMSIYAANGVLVKKKLYRNGRVIKVCNCNGNADCPCIK